MNRFLRHIALENVKTMPTTPNKIKYSCYYPVNDHRLFLSELRKTEESQLGRLLRFTTNYRTNADVQKLVRVINDLDSECDRRIGQLEYGHLFQLMYNFMLLIPNRITQLDYYRRALERMVGEFARSEEYQTKEHFVQIVFYLGLLKKNRHGMDLMHNFLTVFLDQYLDDFTELEFAMVSNAIFKCSMKISNERFNARLEQEVLKLSPETSVDLPLLVTFVKSIRHNRVLSPPVLQKVEDLICQDALNEADFRGYAHLFALFAQSSYVTENLAEVLNRKCLAVIEAESRQLENHQFEMTPEFRQKDLRTFLWANAFLNLQQLSKVDLQKITSFFMHQIDQEAPHHKLDDLIDASLSLVMLNHYPKSLILKIQKEGSFYKNSQQQDRVKLDSRFFLLNSCVAIEAPELMSKQWRDHQATDFETPAPDYLLKQRKVFAQLKGALNSIKEEEDLNIDEVKIITPIRYSNIASYLVQFKDDRKAILIEVLDETNTLMGAERPHGIMALKLRLLQTLGWECIVVRIETYLHSSCY